MQQSLGGKAATRRDHLDRHCAPRMGRLPQAREVVMPAVHPKVPHHRGPRSTTRGHFRRNQGEHEIDAERHTVRHHRQSRDIGQMRCRIAKTDRRSLQADGGCDAATEQALGIRRDRSRQHSRQLRHAGERTHADRLPEWHAIPGTKNGKTPSARAQRRCGVPAHPLLPTVHGLTTLSKYTGIIDLAPGPLHRLVSIWHVDMQLARNQINVSYNKVSECCIFQSDPSMTVGCFAERLTVIEVRWTVSISERIR
ncbi:MAG: hypothetical protein M0Z28_27920 [Rhodospirillales bacterium]|nr:hypothetical protein [Rhodospirillales bacterium]